MSILAIALLAATGTSEAKDRPVSDHTQSVTIAPFKLIEPRAHIEYERSLSDKTGFTVGAVYGNWNGLLLRIFNALSDEDFTRTNMGVNAAYNYHFKHFNRGWFVSGGMNIDNISATLGDDDAGSYTTLQLGPTLGYKVAGEGGFTFAFDFGYGYQAVLAESDDSLMSTPGSSAYMGSTSMGWSF